MKVFLNWSGEESRRIASLLRDWLPEVINALEPWLAADSFGRENRWLEVNAGPFSEAGMIVACVTTANAGEDWKSLDPSKFELSIAESAPLLVLLLVAGVDAASLRNVPDGASVIRLDRSGLKLLAEKLNSLADQPTDYDVLGRRFEGLWPRLEQCLPTIEVFPEGDSVAILSPNGLGGVISISDAVEFAVVRTDRSITPVDIDNLHEQITLLNASFSALRERIAPNLTDTKKPAGVRPRMFIGSSVEGKSIAETIQLGLKYELETTLWTQGVFLPSSTAIESLFEAAHSFEWAVIVMTADDILMKRGVESKMPRDNLLFEAGLFAGALGRARTFIVHPIDEPIEFPSDFRGVTLIDFTQARSDDNLSAALGPVCTQIKRAIGI